MVLSGLKQADLFEVIFTTHLKYFLILILLMLTSSCVYADVVIDPGVQTSTENVSIVFSNYTNFKSMVVGTNEIDTKFQQYNNLTMNPTSQTYINVNEWTATSKRFTMTADSPQIEKYSISGFQPNSIVTFNDNQYTTDDHGKVVFSYYNGTDIYNIVSDLVTTQDGIIEEGTTKEFFVSCPDEANVSWYVNDEIILDGVTIGDGISTLVYTFEKALKIYKVSAATTYFNGTTSYNNFTMVTNNNMHSNSHVKVTDHSSLDTFTNDLQNLSMVQMMKDLVKPETDLLGWQWFGMIIFSSIVFFLIITYSGKTSIAALILLMLGPLFLWALPDQFRMAAFLLPVFSIGGMAYELLKSKS